MNFKHYNLTGILFLLLTLIPAPTVLAQDITIDSADPSSTEQGTFGQPISIRGSGFDKSVKEVKFLIHCEEANCVDDPGGIMVTGFSIISDKEITATIDVSESARLSQFDVAMSTRGRGGKGTTFRSAAIFEVTLRPNQQLVLCDELLENPLGSCTCKFSWDGNENIYGLLDNCVTSETLKLKSMIRTAGSAQANGTERLSITAVLCDPSNGQVCDAAGVAEGTFKGSSVIANAFHRARVRYVDIVIGAGVSDGCNGEEFQSAVSFVLDETTPDPTTTLPQEAPDPINRNSLFFVGDIGIYTEPGQPLCSGIELIREQGYTQKYTPDPDTGLEARDWKIIVSNNEISAGSYVEAGIVMLGMMPMESINPPNVFGNTIENAACGSSEPVGVLFGDFTPDPENFIEGVVESNTIDMAGGCVDAKPVGVQVLGDTGGTQTSVKVNKNSISGAFIGVYADCNVVEAGFSGNTLTGDAAVEDDIGIFSDAQSTSTKGKPNKWRFYAPDDELIDTRNGCP